MIGAGKSFDQPVVEGLFHKTNGSLALIGSRCAGCGTIYFPRVYGCRNPDCMTGQLEPCDLPRCGTLHSFAWQAYQPPPLFNVAAWQPYAIGLINLAPGLQIMGRLDVPREELKIGMPLQLSADVMTEDEGNLIGGYVFRKAETK